MTNGLAASAPSIVDSRYAWFRLGVALVFGTVACAGLWTYVVALPAVQATFSATRADASLPYTVVSVGFAAGNMILGRLADRFGMFVPLLLSIASLGVGYVCAGLAPSLWVLSAAHLLMGFGSAASFGPMMAELSHWFEKRRGIAISVVASGNYLAGAVWPPITQYLIAGEGWRAAFIWIGIFCVVAMLPLSLVFRRGADFHANGDAPAAAFVPPTSGVSQNALFVLLCLAGISCCIAMAMPQVHIIAYCGDLGYGVARGAEMLSLMLAFGLVSRIGSGFVADRFGGVVTLLIGSVMQGVALFLYLLFDGLTSLYLISILFGLFQGGIVPSYAVIIREYFPPQEAGARIGMAMTASVLGMAIGGWMSGWIFDLTGSYRAAFLNGLAWNLLNLAIALWFLRLGRPRARPAMA